MSSVRSTTLLNIHFFRKLLLHFISISSSHVFHHLSLRWAGTDSGLANQSTMFSLDSGITSKINSWPEQDQSESLLRLKSKVSETVSVFFWDPQLWRSRSAELPKSVEFLHVEKTCLKIKSALGKAKLRQGGSYTHVLKEATCSASLARSPWNFNYMNQHSPFFS